MIAIDVLRWPGVNQAFIASFIAALVLSFAIIPYGKRRPVDAPFDWGQAVLSSTYIFGVMFLAFGVVPHQWISHADKNLGWSRDKLLVGWGGFLEAAVAGRVEPDHPPVRSGA